MGCVDDFHQGFAVQYDAATLVNNGQVTCDSDFSYTGGGAWVTLCSLPTLDPTVYNPGTLAVTITNFVGPSEGFVNFQATDGTSTFTLSRSGTGSGPYELVDLTAFPVGATVTVQVREIFGNTFTCHQKTEFASGYYVAAPQASAVKLSLSGPAGWQNLGFDDSGWSAPVGAWMDVPSGRKSYWKTLIAGSNAEVLYVRFPMTLDPVAGSGHGAGSLQDDGFSSCTIAVRGTVLEAYFNGTSFAPGSPFVSGEFNLYQPALPGAALVGTSPFQNLIALRVQNSGSGTPGVDRRVNHCGVDLTADIFAMTCQGGYAYYQVG